MYSVPTLISFVEVNSPTRFPQANTVEREPIQGSCSLLRKFPWHFKSSNIGGVLNFLGEKQFLC